MMACHRRSRLPERQWRCRRCGVAPLPFTGSSRVETTDPTRAENRSALRARPRRGSRRGGATARLLATGDVFGAAYDQLALGRRVVVPDLLGFGRSLDVSRSSFSIDDHLDALDELADVAGLFDCRWSIGAHSMGSALALRWAARHRERVERVVCWGAPLYSSPEAATAEISGSIMTRLFVLDSHWAHRACDFNCGHRSAAGWVMAALQPSLPVAIARNASHHTWPAYRAALRHLVIEAPWRRLLTDLDAHCMRVELVWGTRDRVGDRHHAHTVVDGLANTTVTVVEGADHRLPMTHPETCIDQLRDLTAGL